MYRLVLESLLGLRLEGDTLRLSPCIPADWPGYRVRYRFRDTVYRIHVRQEAGQGAPPRLLVDGAEQPGLAIPRSEEHTSELQSLMRISYAVFCLKKKKYTLQLQQS